MALGEHTRRPGHPTELAGHAGLRAAGANTRTTQLFINLADNTRSLGPQGFAPFGKVIQGMDVVLNLYSGYGESPNQGLIQAQGKAYLDKSFPRLDRIESTTISDATPGQDGPRSSPNGSSALGAVYVSVQNAADRLELNASNGSFSLQEGGQKFTGTYGVNARTLRLHIVELGKDVDIAIDGRRLVVNGDEIWVQPGQ